MDHAVLLDHFGAVFRGEGLHHSNQPLLGAAADGGFTFEPLLMASTGGAALLLVWLREKTGSVLLPILLHNYGNAIFMLI